MNPMGLTQVALAKHLGWTNARVSEIVHGRRGVSAETALAFSDCFGTTPEFWLNLQTTFELFQAAQGREPIEPLKVS